MNSEKVIAYDLGTGGVKASLHDASGKTLEKVFIEYKTFYPRDGWHEQRPEDWWNAITEGTGSLLKKSGCSPSDVSAIALSGQSLVAAPVDKDGNLLLEQIPIWSDTRSLAETEEFFKHIDETRFYMTTGNGFPAPCYSVFKLMWLKKHEPDIFARTHKVLGSKDYINFRMTGVMATDHSYASGTGAYDLQKGEMCAEFLEAAGLPAALFPQIMESHAVLGNLTPDAASSLGLSENTRVACGGVDNSCMALGAVGAGEGGVYTSLGSSSWIAVNSSKPILDAKKKPYVFAHIEKGMYTSAFSIFAGGSSLRWLRDTLCTDLGENAYAEMDKMADTVSIGSNGVLFNPSLAGGTSQDKSIHIRGAFANLSLGTTRSDMIRATMEGIAMNLRMSLESLREHTPLADEILFCGGGSKSRFWMQMFADVFEMGIRKTNIDQDAASLGAAAAALRAVGLWSDYRPIDSLHNVENTYRPVPENVTQYQKPRKLFAVLNGMAAELGEKTHEIYY